MPAKNSTKQYLENGYYHIYNRGVEKRLIFLDKQDYSVFLTYLKEYLLPKNTSELVSKLSDPNLSSKERDKIVKLLNLNNFYGEICMLAYSLMLNHFHFLIKQGKAGSIDKFMNSLATRYTLYFNKKYKRVGPLCQGVYKAVLVTSNEQLLELSRYIHFQSLGSQGVALEGYGEQPSSYREYLGKRVTEWVKTEEILSFFSQDNPLMSYESFVKQENDITSVSDLLIEDND